MSSSVQPPREAARVALMQMIVRRVVAHKIRAMRLPATANRDCIDSGNDPVVTHWMPLPDVPNASMSGPQRPAQE